MKLREHARDARGKPAPSTGTQTYGERVRNPGTRPYRVRHYLADLTRRIMRQQPKLTPAHLKEVLEEELQRIERNPKITQILEGVMHVFQVDSAPYEPFIEMRAILDLPTMRWLRSVMPRSRSKWHDLSWACLLYMAMAPDLPRLDRAVSTLARTRSTAWRWAFRYPQVPAQTKPSQERHKSDDVYRGICRGCKRLTDADIGAARVALVDLYLQRVALMGGFLDLKTVHKGIPPWGPGVHLAADATLVPVWHAQSPRMTIAEERRELDRKGFNLASYVVYKNRMTGLVRKRVYGYRLCVIVDLYDGLPIMFKLIPATGDERVALLDMVQELFRLIPNLPAYSITGDALYDHSNTLAETLARRWHVMGIFSEWSRPSQAIRERFTGGVPICPCGQPGKLKDHAWQDAVWAAKQPRSDAEEALDTEQHLGIPRGEPIKLMATKSFSRYMCANGKCSGKGWSRVIHGAGVTDDNRQAVGLNLRTHPYLARGGRSQHDLYRQALQLRREAIESTFAYLKGNLQLGGGGSLRCRLAGDKINQWILALGLVQMQAAALVRQNGDIQKYEDEARTLGELTPATEDGFELSAAAIRESDARVPLRPIHEPQGWDPQRPSGAMSIQRVVIDLSGRERRSAKDAEDARLHAGPDVVPGTDEDPDSTYRYDTPQQTQHIELTDADRVLRDILDDTF